jgi:hypothetical protein
MTISKIKRSCTQKETQMPNPQTLGTALRATCTAVRELVDALHTGEIPSTATSRGSRNVYHTPSFQQGRAPESSDSKQYSALLISLMLGNQTADRRAHPIVHIALIILELREVGAMDDEDLESIFNGTDGFTRTLLEKVLDKTHTVYVEQKAQQEAVDILSAV